MQHNKKIKEFIEKLEKDKKEIAIDLRTIVLKIAPKSKQDIKWGALVFFKDERPFCGVMPYSNDISVIYHLHIRQTNEIWLRFYWYEFGVSISV